ncbi:MAG: methyltransferase domain-containing protein [Candidatus Latescibacteria bacterium]|nr:methyltransferase domain-containing protein [Candidatus Latescibacterota bacterium]
MSQADSPGIWQTYFDGHAPEYDEQWYTKGAVGQVEAMVNLLKLPAGADIIDVGCGTGRHSVELARRGFCVTGLDFSKGMLAEARKRAIGAETAVNWLELDICALDLVEQFDAGISMLQGAFSLMDPGVDPTDHDLTILRNIERSLRPGGQLLLQTFNAFKTIREFTPEDVTSGRFDPVTMVQHCPTAWTDEKGEQVEQVTRIRPYFPCEVLRLLEQCGFSDFDTWADYTTQTPVSLDGYTFTVRCAKPKN